MGVWLKGAVAWFFAISVWVGVIGGAVAFLGGGLTFLVSLFGVEMSWTRPELLFAMAGGAITIWVSVLIAKALS